MERYILHGNNKVTIYGGRGVGRRGTSVLSLSGGFKLCITG